MIRNKIVIYWYRNCFPEVQKVGLKTKNSKSYSASLFLISLSPLSLFFWNPLSCYTPYPFIGTFPLLISSASLLLAGFRGCLSYHPSVLLFFHHETGLLGVFLLSRLIYKHLMWKRLGREHLINAEVTSFMVLISLWCFQRQVWWRWHLGPKGN